MNGALQRTCDLIRKEGLTELQFCKATGIPQSTWYSWKQRDSIPTNRYMPNITTFLGVSAEYIILGEGENIQKIELDDEPIQIVCWVMSKTIKNYQYRCCTTCCTTSANKK